MPFETGDNYPLNEDREELDTSKLYGRPMFRGSSFVSDVSMTEALADEDEEKLADCRFSVLEYSDTSEEPSRRKQHKQSSARSERKNGRSKSPTFRSGNTRVKETGRNQALDRKQRLNQKNSSKRTNGPIVTMQSRKDHKRSAKQRSKPKSRTLDSGNWVTQLAASFRSPSLSSTNQNENKRKSNEHPMFISSLYEGLHPGNPHEESPLLEGFVENEQSTVFKRQTNNKKGRFPNYVHVAAAFLRDYEASRPPAFGARSLDEISERQVKLHQFRHGNMLYPIVMYTATIALFLSCFFEGFGNRRDDHILLTALNIFAVVVYSFDLMIARDLHRFTKLRRPRTNLGVVLSPTIINETHLNRDNPFDQPLILFCALLLIESCSRLAIIPGHSVIIFSSVFKPLVFFYVSSLARDALQVLGVIVPEVARVLLMDGLLLLLFAAVASRLFQEHDDFENLGVALLSLFELSTSAGNPAIWLPLYEESHFSALFFITFIVISVFFMHSLILSVVFHTYLSASKETRKRAAARREIAIQLAYKSLQFHHHRDQDESCSRHDDRIPISLVQQTLEIIRPHYSTLKINALVEIVASPDQKTVDYATFQAKIRKALNASIRTTRTASTLAMAIELVAVLVAMINFVYVIMVSSQFTERSLSPAAELIGFGITFAAGCELVVRFNPFRIPDFTPLTRMNAAFDGIALVAACTSCFGVLLFLFPGDSATAVNCMLIGRAFDMIRIMRFFQFFRDLVHRSSEVLYSLVGPFFLVITTLHIFVYTGMCLWGGSVQSDASHMYDLNTFNSYQEGIVTMFQVLVVDDWPILAETFLFASRCNSPLIVYTFFVVAYFAGVSIMLNVLTSFFLEAFVTKSNEDTDGPAEATALVHKDRDAKYGLDQHGPRLPNEMFPTSSPKQRRPSTLRRTDGSDHDADSEGSSESGLFEFDVYERNGIDKLVETSTGAFRQENVLQHICSYLEIFESLSPGRQPVGWLVCDQQTMDRFGNHLFQHLAGGFLDQSELQAVVTDMHSELLVLAPTSNLKGGIRVRQYPAKDAPNRYLQVSCSLLSRNPTLSIFVARVVDNDY